MTHAETYCHVRRDIHVELGREIRFLKTLVHRLESVWGNCMPETDLPPLVHEEDGQFVPVPSFRPPQIPQTNLMAGRQPVDRRGVWPQPSPAASMNPLPPGPVSSSGYNFGAATPQEPSIGNVATLQASSANSMPPATNHIARLDPQGDAANLVGDPGALAHKLLMAAGIHLQQKAPAPSNAFQHGGRGHEQRGGESSANTFLSNSTNRSVGSQNSHVSSGNSKTGKEDSLACGAQQLSDAGSDHGMMDRQKVSVPQPQSFDEMERLQ